MGRHKKVEVTPKGEPVIIESDDNVTVTRDRDLTEEELLELRGRYEQPEEEEQTDRPPSKKGILKVKCVCGRVANVSDEVIEDGLSWSMIIGNDHFLTLHCEECGSNLTLFIDELSEEGNKE
jgi:hypothetical protein